MTMPQDTDFDVGCCADLIRDALAEDMASQDATSRAVLPADAVLTAYIVANEDGVCAGLPVAAAVFAEVDRSIVFQPLHHDGGTIRAPQRLAVVTGPARSILCAERTALNFLQQLSGTATLASKYVEAVGRHGVKVKDTRKTIPGWRALQKYAARLGGCENHREGLGDQILIKDNHLRCIGGRGPEAVSSAVKLAKENSSGLSVEVEVEDLDEFRAAAQAGADIIMLDNFELEDIRSAVEEVSEYPSTGPIIEVSGNVTLSTISEIADARPDWISVGRITHSAPALDISLATGGDDE